MIFVTVGTGRMGDKDLIQTMDELAPTLRHPVVMQIGHSAYTPIHSQSFEFVPTLQEYIQQADLVVTSGGIGTLFELLYAHKKIVAVCNGSIPDHHQCEILRKLSDEGYLMFCSDLKRLNENIQTAFDTTYEVYHPPHCWIEDSILDYVKHSKRPWYQSWFSSKRGRLCH